METSVCKVDLKFILRVDSRYLSVCDQNYFIVNLFSPIHYSCRVVVSLIYIQAILKQYFHNDKIIQIFQLLKSNQGRQSHGKQVLSNCQLGVSC